MPIYKFHGEKRNGLQKYRVVVNWTDGGRKRSKERIVYGKTQAELAEAKIRDEIGRLPPPKPRKSAQPAAETITVSELLDLYEKEHGPELRSTSLAKKKSVLNTHVIPDMGPLPVRSIGEAELSAWRSKLNDSPKKVTTKNSAYRELRALFNFAVRKHIIEQSPVKSIRPFRDPYKEASAVKMRYYTKDEFSRYIAEAEKAAEEKGTLRAWGIYVFFMLAYYTGARKGEINALRWSDVDGSCLWIRRSVTQKLKGEAWRETPPKNESSVRRLQMPQKLVAALDAHRNRQRKAEGWSEELFVCGGVKPIPDTALENANAAFAKAAGVKKITVHEFRHSHASLLCNAGINVQEVARRLGHADVQMTLKTYAHLYPQEEERAVAVLDAL